MNYTSPISQIKAKVSLSDLAHKLGIVRKKEKGNYQCFQDQHKDQEKSPTLTITDGKGFKCHGCGLQGSSVIDLYMTYNNCNESESIKGICGIFGPRLPHIQSSNTKTYKKPQSPKYKAILEYDNYLKYAENFKKNEAVSVKKIKALLEQRGIDFKTACKYKIGAIENLFISQIANYNKEHGTKFPVNYDVITFPMYNDKGEYIGLKYRLFKSDLENLKDINLPKSVNLPGSKSGLLFDKDEIESAKEVILCEGEIDGLSLASLGYKNVIMNLGGVGNCMELIKNLCVDKKIICLYDNDLPAKEAVKVLVKALNRGIHYKDLPLAEGKEKTDINEKIKEGWTKKEFDNAISNAELIDNKPIKSALTPISQKAFDGIIIEKYEDSYRKRIFTTKSDEKSYRLSNFSINIVGNYYQDNDVIRECELNNQLGKSSRFFISSKEIVGVTDFEALITSKGNYSFFGTKQDLRLIFDLEYSNAPKSRIVQPERIGYIKKEKIWLFGNLAIKDGKDIIADQDGIFWLNKNKGYKTIDINQYGDKDISLPRLRPFNKHNNSEAIDDIEDLIRKTLEAMKNNIGGYQVYLILGWIKACIYSNEIFEKFKFFPILFLHGKMKSGKNILGGWIMNFFGMKYAEGLSIYETTPVATGRLLDYYSSLPVWIDEYRNVKKCTDKNGFFRNIYNRIGAKKGLKANFGIRQPQVNGTFIISGEELPKDPATRSRMLSIRLSAQDRNDDYRKEVDALSESFSSIVHHWIINKTTENTNNILGAIESTKTYFISEGVDPRTAELYAVPVAIFINTIKDDDNEFLSWCVEDIKRDYSEKESEDLVSVFFSYFEGLHSRNAEDMKNYFDIVEDKEGARLYIWVSGIFTLIKKEHRQAEGENLFGANTLLNNFREEEYYLDNGKTHRINKTSRSCLILDYSKLPKSITKWLKLENNSMASNWMNS